MFSQKNSTMQSNISCSEHNQCSSGMIASSEDMYSQRCNVSYPEPNNCSYDYWSHSSPRQDIDLKTYVGKPLLFAGRIPMHTHKGKNNYPNNSVSQFYDIQQKRTDSSEKEILSNFSNLLKECSDEVKNSLDVMKLNISADFESNVEAMTSSVNNTEELLKKFQDDISIMLKNHTEDLQSENTLKETLLQKDAEIAIKTERIHQMQKQIDKLSAACDLACNKENHFLEDQKIKVKELLFHCCSSADSIKALCNKEVEHNSMLEQLLQQNKNISQDLASIASWQKSTNHVLSTVKSSLTSVSMNVNEINNCNMYKPVSTQLCDQHSGNKVQNIIPSKPVTLPISSIKSLQYLSPLPQYTRWFDVNGKPSPAAIVPPVVSNKSRVCNQKKSTKKILPTFDMSSDSDSGHEMCEIVDKIINNELPLKRQKTYKTTTHIKATPDIKANGLNSESKSTPVQRSIRRYGQIKKFVNPFSPSPINRCPNNIKVANTSKHIKKKFITLDEHWGNTNVSSIKKRVGNNLPSSRGAIMEKRNLASAGKFNGDYLKKLADILNKRGMHTRSMVEV